MTSSSAAAVAPGAPKRQIDSDILGPITVEPDDVIIFEHGLFGFPECREFVLIPALRDGVYWLQSLDHTALAFLLVDPFLFFEDYTVDLSEVDVAELEPEDASDIAVLGIVTLARNRDEPCTVNLQGPVTINLRKRRGRQIVLSDSPYGVRCPLDPAVFEATT